MDELSTLGLLILSGILIRYSLIFTGQLWAKSHAQTITFMVRNNYICNYKHHSK